MREDGQVYFGDEDEIPEADKQRYLDAVLAEDMKRLEQERLRALEGK